MIAEIVSRELQDPLPMSRGTGHRCYCGSSATCTYGSPDWTAQDGTNIGWTIPDPLGRWLCNWLLSQNYLCSTQFIIQNERTCWGAGKEVYLLMLFWNLVILQNATTESIYMHLIYEGQEETETHQNQESSLPQTTQGSPTKRLVATWTQVSMIAARVEWKLASTSTQVSMIAAR